MNFEKQEFDKCKENFVYFFDKYVKLKEPEDNLPQPVKLYFYQKRLIETVDANRFVIGSKFRQGGFSTVMVAWLLWRFIFKWETNAFFAGSERLVRDAAWIAKGIFGSLPNFLQPTDCKFSDHEFSRQGVTQVPDNPRDWIQTSTSKLYFNSLKTARGKALDNIYLDESYFIKDMENQWQTLLPCFVGKGKIVILSSFSEFGSLANLKENNWFLKTLDAARKQENLFAVYSCCYKENPKFDDPKFEAETRKNLGEKLWRTEFLQERVWEELDIRDRFTADGYMAYLSALNNVWDGLHFIQEELSSDERNIVKNTLEIVRALKEKAWETL